MLHLGMVLLVWFHAREVLATMRWGQYKVDVKYVREGSCDDK